MSFAQAIDAPACWALVFGKAGRVCRSINTIILANAEIILAPLEASSSRGGALRGVNGGHSQKRAQRSGKRPSAAVRATILPALSKASIVQI